MHFGLPITYELLGNDFLEAIVFPTKSRRTKTFTTMNTLFAKYGTALDRVAKSSPSLSLDKNCPVCSEAVSILLHVRCTGNEELWPPGFDTMNLVEALRREGLEATVAKYFLNFFAFL